MWWFVLKNVILSICIILMIQYLWEYCKTHFTKRKTKHIVDTQTQKYRNIIKEIQHGTPANSIQNESLSTTATDYISEKDKAQMIKELTQFLHAETAVFP